MGAKISKDSVEPLRPYPIPKPLGDGTYPPYDTDPFEIATVSASRFYCLVQQAAVWPDYYAIFDMRDPAAYAKKHVVGALENPGTQDLDWAGEMIVLLYSNAVTDPAIKDLVEALKGCDYPPSKVYVLDVPFKKLAKRYRILTSDSPYADSLPGPTELVPPTSKAPGVYAIHRVHFLRAKGLISNLYCGSILNISSRRLYIKTPGIVVENHQFDDNPAPTDKVTQVFMSWVSLKPKKKGKKNILIIDESGCDYGAILAGWALVQVHQKSLVDATESVTSRVGFLDSWYTEVLESWTST